MRDSLGLAPGVKIEVEEVDGGVTVHPVGGQVRLGRSADGKPVLVYDWGVPPLAGEQVRAVLETAGR